MIQFADQMDTITVEARIDETPSGDTDGWAARRVANGLLKRGIRIV